MARRFNVARPCRPDWHYMLPTHRRIEEVPRIVDEGGYFVVHAPRQVGKTTSLLSLSAELTASGRYVALLVSCEVGAPFGDDLGAAELAMLHAWRAAAAARLPPELQPPEWPDAPPGGRVSAALAAWSAAAPRRLVLFLDEIDALRDAALVGVLRQLRDGFANRPKHFPWSLALVGLRDVRDYKVASGGSGHLGTSSPFNIKIESVTLRDFDRAEVVELYRQHTEETGQIFDDEALDRAFDLTMGQPWLVNALAR